MSMKTEQEEHQRAIDKANLFCLSRKLEIVRRAFEKAEKEYREKWSNT
jgi:hypothetical protein